jgi:hypothetical protein
MPTSGGGRKEGGEGRALLYTFLLGGILGAQGKTSTFAFTLCILAFKYTGF